MYLNTGQLQYIPIPYLRINFVPCRGSTSPLNSISDIDNEITNGVVTCTLIFLYFSSAAMIRRLKINPITEMIKLDVPAK